MIRQLWQLQELDERLGQLQSQLDGPSRVGEFEQRLARRREQLAEAETELGERQRRLRADELELKTQEGLAQGLHGKLYGGTVRDSRELQKMEGDLAKARAAASQLEEEILEAMDSVEGLAASLERAHADLAEAEQDLQEAHEDARERQTLLEGRLAQTMRQRGELARGLEAALVEEYEGLRRRCPPAVGKAKGGYCRTCHMELSDAVQRALIAGSLTRCNNCARFLGLEGRL